MLFGKEDQQVNTLNLQQLKEIALKANEVAQNWHLTHEDTYIAAEKVPEEHDWYWIVGSMERPATEWDQAIEDEEMRGPKEVIRACCRHIQTFNPQMILELLARIE